MPIYLNSWVVIRSENGIVQNWHKPMCADDAKKIYNQYQNEGLKKCAEKNVLPNITGCFTEVSNKWIDNIIKNWRGDMNMVAQIFLGMSFTSEYGSTKIELLHSSQT